MSARVVLELRGAPPPCCTEIGSHVLQIGGARAEESVVQAGASLEHRDWTVKASAGELRRDDAAVRRPAGVQPFRPRAIGEELHQSARHAAGKTHRLCRLARIEAVKL